MIELAAVRGEQSCCRIPVENMNRSCLQSGSKSFPHADDKIAVGIRCIADGNRKTELLSTLGCVGNAGRSLSPNLAVGGTQAGIGAVDNVNGAGAIYSVYGSIIRCHNQIRNLSSAHRVNAAKSCSSQGTA